MIDCNFPHIIYDSKKSYLEWGLEHGESQKEGIRELSQVRLELILQKSPHLVKNWKDLAITQANLTNKYFPELFKEIQGISKGSNVELEKIIVLNNYTDFRDIKDQDEGCTSLGVNKDNKISAQTWDMHSTAKNYVCVIELPGNWITFSLVGCLGMMGANKDSFFIGVNNINTNDARPGIIWPAFVRASLSHNNIKDVLTLAENTPFTSGHNYLLSNGNEAEHWEISPSRMAKASGFGKNEEAFIFHTNHCLSEKFKDIEVNVAQSSTTHDRHRILEKYQDKILNKSDVIRLLKSHEGFPKSVCGHFESGAQDPSMTCGGGVFDHKDKEFYLWRGCEDYDKNYKEYNIRL